MDSSMHCESSMTLLHASIESGPDHISNLSSTSISKRSNNTFKTYSKGSSPLEQLPNELMQDIWVRSLNLYLPFTSPTLSSKLHDHRIRRLVFAEISKLFCFTPKNCTCNGPKEATDRPSQSITPEFEFLWNSKLMTKGLLERLRRSATRLQGHEQPCQPKLKAQFHPLLHLSKTMCSLPFTTDKMWLLVLLNSWLDIQTHEPSHQLRLELLLKAVRAGDVESTDAVLNCNWKHSTGVFHLTLKRLGALAEIALNDGKVSCALGRIFTAHQKPWIATAVDAIPSKLWTWAEAHIRVSPFTYHYAKLLRKALLQHPAIRDHFLTYVD